MDPYYIVVFDKELGWCRLFRSDSEDCPSEAEALWKGYNLEVGYEQMKRLNRERREIPSYYVCERSTDTENKIRYKIQKVKPINPWIEIEQFHDYSKAQEKIRELCRVRDEKNQAFRSEVSERKQSFMERLNIRSAHLRLDEKSQKYINWALSAGKFTPEEKENMLWLQENGIIELDLT